MKISRTKATALNSVVVICVRMGMILLGFVQRSFLIQYLGVEYLGIDGLFSNILTLLSLSELGFGTALIYSMYKPWAERDFKKISQLMSLYKKFYTTVGMTVIGIGCIIAPFLSFFIKEAADIQNLTMIYLMYVVNTGISYFYIYRQSLLNVAQENYIVNTTRFIVLLLQNIIQIIVLKFFHEYIAFYAVTIFGTFAVNAIISIIAKKKYPLVVYHSDEKLSSKEMSEIKRNIGAMFLHKVGSVVLSATDNILISRMINIVTVGLYSNYTLICGAISGTVQYIFIAITPSIGNLRVTADDKKSYAVFRRLCFIVFLFSGFVSIELFILINPLITIWIGESYCLKHITMGTIIFNLFLSLIRSPALYFREAYGLFYKDRLKPVAAAIVNLLISIILGRVYGVLGIVLGTIISKLLVEMWVEALLLYKYVFKKKFGYYLLDLLKYTLFIGISCAICFYITKLIHGEEIVMFILKALIILLIYVALLLLVYAKTDNFNYYLNIIRARLERSK